MPHAKPQSRKDFSAPESVIVHCKTFMQKPFRCCFILSTFCICLHLFLFTGKLSAQKQNLQKVTLALQWHTQCQFAGYYVGLEKGFYRGEGIDLSIIPGATDVNPIPMVSAGIADFGTKWLADFLGAVEQGFPLISIAQIVQKNGLILISKAESGIKTPYDFIGRHIGIRFSGNEIQMFALMNKLGIPLSNLNIHELKCSIDHFLHGEYDVIMAMTYNEYLKVLDSGYQKEEINVIDFAQYGLNFPGHVIFTRRTILEENPGLCLKMVRASLRGWSWAIKHPEKAVDIVLKHDKSKSLKKAHQLKQMKEITKLINYGGHPLGYHCPAEVEFVVESLVRNHVISRPLNLKDVYTNDIWQKARLQPKP